MYVPEKFRVDDIDVLHNTMRQIGAAAVVGKGPDGIVATHVPIELDTEAGAKGVIRCHFARPNPHAEAIAAGAELLLIFQGPQGYVTPSWYPSKHRTGKAVPTWNYIAIHAYGTAKTVDDPDWLKAHLAALTDHFESPYAVPWKLEDAPDGFIDGMCRAIVGIEVEVTRLEGKWKLNQNKAATDAFGVVNGLRAEGGDANNAMADLVLEANGSQPLTG
ncbi:MAG: FMN-binding negative transcriptional regulator [Rhodospirillaceae bacterium]|nr:FMN-binding negative transcriptional regulator [Rhodospirillaceae bacterium]MDD9917981.1 FMN-binding negative transcriptional regulator [Rhodospirillaceae bacterium]